MENQPVGAVLIYVKRRMYGQMDKTMLLGVLWNYANVPKNHLSYKNFKDLSLCNKLDKFLYVNT